MNDYASRRKISIYALRAFPRSAAIISAAIVTAVSLDPASALGVALSIWLTLSFFNFLIRIIMPDIVDRGIWLVCSFLVIPIGGWLLQWPVAIIAGVVALIRGSAAAATLSVLGGMLLFDLIMTIFFRPRGGP